MVLPLKVSDAEGEEFWGPYLILIPGWTEERYFAEAPEMWYVEFADGELIVHSPVSIRHQQVTGFLTALLQIYAEDKKLGMVLAGPAVVRLRPDLNHEPDVFFIATGQLSQLEQQRFSVGPGLVVEVLSESTRNYDLGVKAANYYRHGVAELWIVDPENRKLQRHTVSEHAPDSYSVEGLSSGRLESREIPGFWIDVSWLWAEPLPPVLQCLRQLLEI